MIKKHLLLLLNIFCGDSDTCLFFKDYFMNRKSKKNIYISKIFCINITVLLTTVNFDQFKASSLNISIIIIIKPYCPNQTFEQ